jgi:hypothetical protein
VQEVSNTLTALACVPEVKRKNNQMESKEILEHWMGYIKQVYIYEAYNLKEMIIETYRLATMLKACKTDKEKVEVINLTINQFMTHRFMRHMRLSDKLKDVRSFVVKELNREQDSFAEKKVENLLKSAAINKNLPQA